MTSTVEGTALDTAAAVLEYASQRRRAAQRAEAEVVNAAALWADQHPVDSILDAATWPGTQGELALAGEGAPLVAEFCIAESAVAIGVPTDAGRDLIAQTTVSLTQTAAAERRHVKVFHGQASCDGTCAILNQDAATGAVENHRRLTTLEQIRTWCCREGQVTIEPVIDLNARLTHAGDEVPDRIAERVTLRDRSVSTKSWSTTPAPPRSPAPAPGQVAPPAPHPAHAVPGGDVGMPRGGFDGLDQRRSAPARPATVRGGGEWHPGGPPGVDVSLIRGAAP